MTAGWPPDPRPPSRADPERPDGKRHARRAGSRYTGTSAATAGPPGARRGWFVEIGPGSEIGAGKPRRRAARAASLSSVEGAVSGARWLLGFSIIVAVGGLAHVADAQDAGASRRAWPPESAPVRNHRPASRHEGVHAGRPPGSCRLLDRAASPTRSGFPCRTATPCVCPGAQDGLAPRRPPATSPESAGRATSGPAPAERTRQTL